jgi:hypothetical protein
MFINPVRARVPELFSLLIISETHRPLRFEGDWREVGGDWEQLNP